MSARPGGAAVAADVRGLGQAVAGLDLLAPDVIRATVGAGIAKSTLGNTGTRRRPANQTLQLKTA